MKTREELKKKAEEYRKGRKDLNYFSEPYKQKIERAYLAGAEPREKRIAELEKENAELKGQLEKRSCHNCKRNNKDCPNDGSCKNLSLWEPYKNLQLIKAKEIILKLSTCLEGHSNNKFEYELLQEAEQFLREVENA